MVNIKFILIFKRQMDLWTNPETYGQKWIDIHELSAHIESREEIPGRVKSIQIILNSIRCIKCSNDIKKYMEKHSIEKYYDRYDEQGRWIGIFDYFYEFHNTVNLRLGKPHMNYKTAIEMYFEPIDYCDSFCGI